MENHIVETETKMNFYLSTLEEDVRSHLKDSQAKLTQSKCEGRVLLDIQEDLLSNFLEQLEGKTLNQWGLENAQLRKEIRHLLREAYDKQTSSQSYISDLKSQLDQAHNPELQAENTKALQLQIEFMKAEKETLEKELDALKLEVRAEKQLRLVAEDNLETSTHCLKLQLFDKENAEFEVRNKVKDLERDLLFEQTQTEKLWETLSKAEECLVKQKQEAKRSTERAQASHQAQIEEHKAETRKITADLKNTQDQLETQRLIFNKEKTSMEEKMEKSRASFLAQLDEERNKLMVELKEAKNQLTTERLQWQDEKLSIVAELEREKQERTNFEAAVKTEIATLTTALMESKDALKNNGVQWQQEKSTLLEEIETSKQLYVSQIDLEKKANIHLMAAMKKTEEHCESLRSEWKEEKSFLLQATQELKDAQEKKEQEWETLESSMRAHVEELEHKIAKKKKKWYRRFICSAK